MNTVKPSSEMTELETTLEQEDKLIAKAISVLHERLITYENIFTSPQTVRSYLKLQLAEQQREIFCCLLMDSQHRLIQFRELFMGTIDGCAVYPREVVKIALQENAAAVIFAHNHPSGVAEPSTSDERITRRLKEALSLIDVRVLDHIVVGADEIVSFAERGML